MAKIYSRFGAKLLCITLPLLFGSQASAEGQCRCVRTERNQETYEVFELRVTSTRRTLAVFRSKYGNADISAAEKCLQALRAHSSCGYL